MSYFSRYDKGDWKALCDVCGREFKASQLNKRWDGLMCCRQDWEPRQPQDFVRGVADPQLTPWTRPEPAESWIAVVTSSFMSLFSTLKTTLDVTVYIHHALKVLNYLVSLTPTLSYTVFTHFTNKVFNYLVSSFTTLNTNTIPAPAPSQQAVNGDSINNQSLG